MKRPRCGSWETEGEEGDVDANFGASTIFTRLARGKSAKHGKRIGNISEGGKSLAAS